MKTKKRFPWSISMQTQRQLKSFENSKKKKKNVQHKDEWKFVGKKKVISPQVWNCNGRVHFKKECGNEKKKKEKRILELRKSEFFIKLHE